MNGFAAAVLRIYFELQLYQIVECWD